MTARDEILAAARHLSAVAVDESFTVDDIVRYLATQGSRYAEATIRTHVISRMCANAPDHHARTFGDLIRVAEVSL